MDFTQIWQEVKEYVPVSAIAAAIFTAYLTQSIHKYDALHGDRLKHEKIWVPLVLSAVFTGATILAGFIPAKEFLWNIAAVYCGSSIYYQLKIKHKSEAKE